MQMHKIVRGIVRTLKERKNSSQSQRLFFDFSSASAGPRAYPNNNDMASAYHTFNFIFAATISRNCRIPDSAAFQLMPLAVDGGPPREWNGCDLSYRAEGNDLSSNIGSQIRRTQHFRRIEPSAECAFRSSHTDAQDKVVLSPMFPQEPFCRSRFLMHFDTEYRFHRRCEQQFGDALREWQSHRYRSRPGGVTRKFRMTVRGPCNVRPTTRSERTTSDAVQH